MFKNFSVKNFLKDTASLIAGGTVFAAGLCVFSAPNGILTGGASGIAIILGSLFKIPLGLGIIIVNIPVLIAAFFVCGKRYTLKTLYAVVLFSAVIDIFELLVPARYGENPLLGAIYGGILTAIGLFIVMKRSIVTGGSDLLAYIIQRVRPGRQMGTLLLIIDGVIAALGAVIYRSFETALYSMVLIIILTMTLNTLLSGRTQGAVHFIFSQEIQNIKECIDKELGRGCTVICARGGYNDDPRDIVMCAVNLRESVLLRRRVFEIDDKAFIIIADAARVCGNGFLKPEKEEIF